MIHVLLLKKNPSQCRTVLDGGIASSARPVQAEIPELF
jgi:hypothetical protein